MKEIAAQLKGGVLYPLTIVDQEEISEFKDNQILKLKVVGAQKQRSYLQLKMYWALCGVVAENTEHPYWNTKEKVDYQVRVALQFVDPNKMIVDGNGMIHLYYRSISFANLKHMDACKFFDRAWPVMAKHIGITEEKLLANQG